MRHDERSKRNGGLVARWTTGKVHRLPPTLHGTGAGQVKLLSTRSLGRGGIRYSRRPAVDSSFTTRAEMPPENVAPCAANGAVLRSVGYRRLADRHLTAFRKTAFSLGAGAEILPLDRLLRRAPGCQITCPAARAGRGGTVHCAGAPSPPRRRRSDARAAPPASLTVTARPPLELSAPAGHTLPGLQQVAASGGRVRAECQQRRRRRPAGVGSPTPGHLIRPVRRADDER